MNTDMLRGSIERIGYALMAGAALMAVIYTLAAWYARWRWWAHPQPRPKAPRDFRRRSGKRQDWRVVSEMCVEDFLRCSGRISRHSPD